MKKLIVAMIGSGLLLSANAFSLTPECGSCGYAQGLCAPKLAGGFYFGVTGAYVKATESAPGFNDGFFNVNSDDDLFVTTEVTRFDPDYEWAWGVTAGYDLPCSAYSLEFNYFHAQETTEFNSDTDSAGDFASNFFARSGLPIDPDGITVSAGSDLEDIADLATPIVITDVFSHEELKTKLDQADLKFGRQFNDVCGHFSIRPSVGVRYAKVDHNLHDVSVATLEDIAFSVIVPPSDTNFFPEVFLPSLLEVDILSDIDLHSKFDGIGPLVSLDARYSFCGNFGLVGHFDAALLMGEVESHLTNATIFDIEEVIDSPSTLIQTGVFPSATRFNTPDTDRLVGNVSGKVGLDYTFCFCNKSSLTIEVGYQASKYYDAVDLVSGSPGASPLLAPASPLNPHQVIINTESANFSVSGPYATVTYHL